MDLSALKVVELREIATQRGLSAPLKCKKQELIDAITASMAAEGADDVTVRTTTVAEGKHHDHPYSVPRMRTAAASRCVCSNVGRSCGNGPLDRVQACRERGRGWIETRHKRTLRWVSASDRSCSYVLDHGR
jgi:hypothetical protein